MRTVQSYILQAARKPGAIGRRAIRQITRRSYTLAKACYHYELHRSSLRHKDPPLVIYQMGKVGSSTVRRSLEALELDRPIYHTHFLTQEYIDREEKRRRKYFGIHKANRANWNAPRRPWLNQYLRNQIERGLKGKRWKVVTLVREPIARNISAFYENLAAKRLGSGHQYHIVSSYRFEITVDLEDLEPLIALFFEKFDHDTPLVYLDREIKGVLGIDVFSSEFPKSKGYKIYEGEQVDLLLLRLESLNECASDAFREFLNLEDFNLIKANITDEKDDAAIYRKILDSIVLPDSYIDTMLTSKYARHFYSEEEINVFRAKWRKENGV